MLDKALLPVGGGTRLVAMEAHSVHSVALLLGWCCALVHCAPPQLNLQKTRVSGPGVGAATSPLPVNYFYIQALDDNGNELV